MISILELVGYFLAELPAHWLADKWTDSLSKDNRNGPILKKDIRDDPVYKKNLQDLIEHYR